MTVRHDRVRLPARKACVNPAEAFKRVLSQGVAPAFKAGGFIKVGPTFYLREAGNWGVANFQKSSSNTAEHIRFTLNLGIYSARIAKGLGERQITRPAAWHCQCELRSGLLRSDPHDLWWSIDGDTDLDALGAELASHVGSLAIPWVKQHVTDEALRELWREGAYGCTAAARVRYLNASRFVRLHGRARDQG
jgi:hypothetical protein